MCALLVLVLVLIIVVLLIVVHLLPLCVVRVVVVGVRALEMEGLIAVLCTGQLAVLVDVVLVESLLGVCDGVGVVVVNTCSYGGHTEGTAYTHRVR